MLLLVVLLLVSAFCIALVTEPAARLSEGRLVIVHKSFIGELILYVENCRLKDPSESQLCLRTCGIRHEQGQSLVKGCKPGRFEQNPKLDYA